MRKTNQAGIDLIKHYEGFQSEAYRDPVGVVTIGYGHTASTLPHAVMGMVITESQAQEYLVNDLSLTEQGVEDAVKVPTTDNQFSSLVSFAFNLGLGNLKSSTLLKLLNSGDYIGAKNQFVNWDKAGGKVLNGLLARRRAEADLFSA